MCLFVLNAFAGSEIPAANRADEKRGQQNQKGAFKQLPGLKTRPAASALLSFAAS